MKKATVLLLPGFGGHAEQPILTSLSTRLESRGFSCTRKAPPRLSLKDDLQAYGEWLDGEVKAVSGPLIVVGRSFGGRLAVRLAARRPLAGLVLLGFPIRPPGKPRLADEAALGAVRCPTWVAQGTKDPLGPLAVLRRVVRTNAHVQIFPVRGARHEFGTQEAATLDAAASWLDLIDRER